MKIFANGKTRGHVLKQTKQAGPLYQDPNDYPPGVLPGHNYPPGVGQEEVLPPEHKQIALRELQDCMKMMEQIQETLSKNTRFARMDPEINEQIKLLLRAIKGLQIEPGISDLASDI